VVTAATTIFPYSLLAAPEGAAMLTQHGFRFPLLLRAPGFHMGQHFVKVESPDRLAVAVAELPRSGSEAELLAIEYLDARGADGQFRKYRVMIVGGRLYPLHLAISRNWKIHYFSADMADRPEHRAEEAKFLADMPGVLGAKAMAALARVQATLGLDYGGIDFGLSRQGEALVFEANATMVVEQPSADERWDYRRAAVERIHAAVRQMLMARAAAVGAPR
jgi:glutathione synthase/RimK-type ligase-like ATP-grasp enzyme